jgi:hypothetical protein
MSLLQYWKNAHFEGALVAPGQEEAFNIVEFRVTPRYPSLETSPVHALFAG